MLRIYFILFLMFFLMGCQAYPPVQVAETQPVYLPSTTIPMFTPAIEPSLTLAPTPVSSPTASPVPCDLNTADFCLANLEGVFLRPVMPPANQALDITYLYGSTQNGKRDPHHGVEIQNPFGTPVYAAADGVVVFAETDAAIKFSPWSNFYGNMVLIKHEENLYTLYAHLSSVLVTAGMNVAASQEIGQVGASGGATGSHLHFEVRSGQDDYTDYFSTLNPALWLVPLPETGALSIEIKTKSERNFAWALVVTQYDETSETPLFVHYVSAYPQGFEHNAEDAALTDLPPGRYKIAFSGPAGMEEKFVQVLAGRLTEVLFDLR